jgi:hypothetical protein
VRTLTALLLSSLAFATASAQEVLPEVLRQRQEQTDYQRRMTEERYEGALHHSAIEHEVEKYRIEAALKKIQSQTTATKAQTTPATRKIRLLINGQWVSFDMAEDVDVPPPPRDRDGDGIPDDQDTCPDDPSNRCDDEPPPPPPLDSDGDGIPDCEDPCKDDPENKCAEPVPVASGELLGEKQVEVLKRLWAEGHPWTEMVRGFADKEDGVYGDFGQWCVIAWYATGDATYGRRAIKHFDVAFVPAVNSRSYTRELFGVFSLQYMWLRPLMTDAEAVDFRNRLLAWADLVYDPTVHGTRIGDSDEVWGHFWGIKLMLKALEKEEPERCAVVAANPQLVLWREEIKRYCALSAGGEHVESNEYNLGTLQLILTGLYGLGNFEEYPEVVAMLKEVAVQQRWQIKPGFQSSTQWGDEQGRELFLNYRVTLNAMLAGLTGDQQNAALVDKLTEGKPPYSAYWFTLYRGLWCFDPSAPTPEYVVPQGYRTTRIGLTIYRGPNYLCEIFAPTWNGVDHENATYPTVRIFWDGEQVLDHPLGYQAVAQTQNVPILAGHLRMANMSVIAEELPNGCRVTWHTDGKLPNSWAHFMDGFKRTIEFTAPNKLVIVDSFKGRKPTAEELAYGDLVAKTANAPALWQVIYHCPEVPLLSPTGATWNTKGGKTVTITAEGHENQVYYPTATSPNLGGWFGPGELDGYQVRFLSDAPTAEIKTVVEITPAKTLTQRDTKRSAKIVSYSLAP